MNEELVRETLVEFLELLDESGLSVAEAMTAVLSLTMVIVEQVVEDTGNHDLVDLTRKHFNEAFDEIGLNGVVH
jgi:hypothetical protein